MAAEETRHRWLTTEEAAEILDCHPATVRRRIERNNGYLNGVRCFRIGTSGTTGPYRVPAAAVYPDLNAALFADKQTA